MRTVTTRSRASASAGRHVPALRAAARAARRSRSATASRRVPVGVPSDGVVAERVAGRGLALRLALVEQRGDRLGVELRLLLRLRLLRRLRRLGLLLRLLLRLLGCPSSALRRSDRASALPWRSLLRLGLGLRRLRLGRLRLRLFLRLGRGLRLGRRSARSRACRRPWRSGLRPASPRRPSRPAASAASSFGAFLTPLRDLGELACPR